MPPAARRPLGCRVLRLRSPCRTAGSPGRTQGPQHVVDGAQLHSLHRRGRAFLVRDLGAEARLVDGHATEFVLDVDGVALARLFRLEQRHFGGGIDRFPVLFRPSGPLAFEMRAAKAEGAEAVVIGQVSRFLLAMSPLTKRKAPLMT